MNSLTLACLLGLTASIKVQMPPPQGDGGSPDPNDPSLFPEPENPCADVEPQCGDDPCMNIAHPCDEITESPAFEECWATNADVDPWTPCYNSDAGKAW